MHGPLSPAFVKPAVVFGAGLLIRLWLIHAYPIVFGGDTILRLANRDHVLLSYQLPVLQVLLYAISKAGGGLLEIRWMMAAAGAAASAGFYLMVRAMLDERLALASALLFAVNPFLVELSIVPYQEVIMVGGLCLSLAFYFRERLARSSASLALACLTRYEAWIAAPVLAAARGKRDLLAGCLLFGWAPLVWMMFHAGVSAPGTFVVEWPRSPWRLMRWVYIGWITVKNTPAPVLALAVLGGWSLWRGGLYRRRDVRILAATGALFLLSILFSAHGVSPDPERFVASREATLPIAGAIVLAAFGIAACKSAKAAWLLAAGGILWSVFDAQRFVRRDTSEPHLQLSYELARYLDGTVRDGERVLILAAPPPPELLNAYFDKVRRRQGEVGIERARQVMAGMDTNPPDCQRTFVHSRLPRARFLCGAGEAEWIASWSDGPPFDPQGAAPVQVLRSGNFSVAVYQSRRTPH
jgi:hypothetical protein